MELKLIVVDLDGTLLDSAKREISLENANALKIAQSQGANIAIATGRCYSNVIDLCQRAGLKTHVISNHGAFIHTQSGQCLQARGLDEEALGQAIDWLDRHEYYYSVDTANSAFVAEGASACLYRDFENASTLVELEELSDETLPDLVERLASPWNQQVIKDLKQVVWEKNVVSQIRAVSLDADKLNAGRKHFSSQKDITMTVAGKAIFELIHPDVSKGNALEILASHLSISLEKVMAIGDNYNDISMLKKAGISVAIGNAEDKVKECCQYVALSNDEDGVAHIVLQMLG